jgi:hypothetical protein
MTKFDFRFIANRFKMVKKIIWVFLVIQIVFGFLLSILFGSAVTGMVNTVATIRFPFSIIRKEYNASNPWIEYSFFVKNENVFDLISFQASISIDILYFNKSDDSQIRRRIYEKTSMYYNTPSGEILFYLINGTSENFYLKELDNFWSFADMNKSVSSLFHAFFKGTYLSGLISFNLKVSNLNMSKFEF